MKPFRWILLLIGFASLAIAEIEVAPQAEFDPIKTFKSAVENHKNKNYPEAEKLYLQVLNDNPETPEVLKNLGLLYFTTENSGRALGFLRSLTQLEPRDIEIYRTIDFIENKLTNKDFEHDRSFFEDLYLIFLRWIKLPELLIIHFLIASLFGIFFVRRLTLKKKSLLLDPKIEVWTPQVYTGAITLFLMSGLTLLKIQTSLEDHATIIAKNKLTLKSGPSENGADLYELFEGFEVVIDSTYKNWSQITYQNRYTGWVKSNTIWKHIK